MESKLTPTDHAERIAIAIAGEKFKVVLSYERNGESITQSLYLGPNRISAAAAYNAAYVLMNHMNQGLRNCTVRFLDASGESAK